MSEASGLQGSWSTGQTRHELNKTRETITDKVEEDRGVPTCTATRPGCIVRRDYFAGCEPPRSYIDYIVKSSIVLRGAEAEENTLEEVCTRAHLWFASKHVHVPRKNRRYEDR